MRGLLLGFCCQPSPSRLNVWCCFLSCNWTWLLRQGRRRAQQLNDLLGRYMLRRTKAIISDLLPKKEDNIVFCQLSDMQRRAYRYKWMALPCYVRE